jgi:phosphatidate cytidylyltransferase
MALESSSKAGRFKDLGKRTLTAAVFVAALLGSLFAGYWAFTLFFGLAAVLGLREFYNLSAHAGTKPLSATGLVLGSITYLVFVRWDFLLGMDLTFPIVQVVSLLIVIVLAASLYKPANDSFSRAFVTAGGIFYVVLPFSLLHRLVIINFPAGHYSAGIVLAVILLIWANDTFAYLWGSLFGRHKLLERVSPGKTWEGTVLGALTTFGCAFIIRSWEGYGGGFFWPLLGLLVPVFATLGDLAESQLKRLAGVKDSGNLMPGHGGVLDRFDSLLFVAPFVTLLVSVL